MTDSMGLTMYFEYDRLKMNDLTNYERLKMKDLTKYDQLSLSTITLGYQTLKCF